MFSSLPRPNLHNVIWILLCAQLLFGIALIAILPPFEGLDETAIFSGVQSHNLPMSSTAAPRGSDMETMLPQSMSMEVFDYYRRGPMPYQWIRMDELHKDDAAKKYITYSNFSRRSRQFRESYITGYDKSPLPAVYNPSPEMNWEHQSAAFYEIIMAPAMRLMAGHAALVPTLLILRLFSFTLAFVGFCVGLFATKSYLEKTGVTYAGMITTFGALYPFLVPAFFWEFARLGNDSLCLLAFGILWALVLWHLHAPRSWAWLLAPFALGLVWLSKSTMLPACLGIAAFLILHPLLTKTFNWRDTLKMVAALILACVASAYANLLLIGAAPGASSIVGSSKNFLGTLQSMIWLFGSWSHLIIDFHLHMVLVLFAVMIMATYIIAARRKTDPFFFLPLWAIIPALIMLFATNGNGALLHILAPAIALITGLTFQNLFSKKITRIVITILCVPVVLLNFFIAWSYATVFSGCAVPVPMSDDYRLPLTEIFHCRAFLDTVIGNMDILAWPHTALLFFAASFITLLVAGAWLLLIRSEKTAPDPQI